MIRRIKKMPNFKNEEISIYVRSCCSYLFRFLW